MLSAATRSAKSSLLKLTWSTRRREASSTCPFRHRQLSACLILPPEMNECLRQIDPLQCERRIIPHVSLQGDRLPSVPRSIAVLALLVRDGGQIPQISRHPCSIADTSINGKRATNVLDSGSEAPLSAFYKAQVAEDRCLHSRPLRALRGFDRSRRRTDEPARCQRHRHPAMDARSAVRNPADTGPASPWCLPGSPSARRSGSS